MDNTFFYQRKKEFHECIYKLISKKMSIEIKIQFLNAYADMLFPFVDAGNENCPIYWEMGEVHSEINELEMELITLQRNSL